MVQNLTGQRVVRKVNLELIGRIPLFKKYPSRNKMFLKAKIHFNLKTDLV